jgi:hypothetical protein
MLLRQSLSIGLLFVLAACAGMEGEGEAAVGRETAILPQEILPDLRPGEGEFAPDLVYVTEAARRRRGSYDKILLDPIMYFAPLEHLRSVSPSDRQTLANNFHILMGRQLAQDYLLALEPQRGTLRVQFAILPDTREPVAMDTVAMVARLDPDSQVVTDDLASPLVPGSDLVVEAEWTDAVTGEVLGATVDLHFGQTSFDGRTLESWADVNRYLEAYAALIRYRLCRFRAQESCTLPPPPLG